MDFEDGNPDLDGKPNCREFMMCGRQLGGESACELGVYPWATDVRIDGTHGVINAGRACWVVDGTFCGGEEQGTFAQKYRKCSRCGLYESIRSEEGDDLVPSMALLNMLA